jgi:hypothetical protein
MDLLINAVAVTTRQMVPTTVIIPKIIWSGFNGLFFIHRMWRWFRCGSIYKNPDNFFKLATGHGLNFVVGGSIITRASAQLVLIITRIIECVERQNSFVRSYQKLLNALKDNYPACPYKKETLKTLGGIFSPSTYSNVKFHMIHGWNYVTRVAKRLYKLAKSAFKLSMHLMDAVYAFSLSPATANEGINQLFVNGTKTLDLLANNKEDLLQKLKDHRGLLDTLFKKIGSNYQAENFIAHISKVLQIAKSTQQAAKKIDHHGSEVLKHGALGFLGGLGFAQLTPHCLIPSREAPWEGPFEDIPKERFAPVDWVTRSDIMVNSVHEKEKGPLYVKQFSKGQFSKYVEVVLENSEENPAVDPKPVKPAFKMIEKDISSKPFKFNLSHLKQIFAH